MRFSFQSFFKYIFLLILVGGAFQVDASIISGSIDSSNYTAQICENTLCTVTDSSTVNFGNFTTQSAYDVVVNDTSLRGYIWGEGFGWAVLNCLDTVSGCSATNGNFKVANDYNGTLSGYAWGDSVGWINFGPFSNSTTSQISIDTQGRFNGYAWTQNFGWMKFDCSNSSYCVQTDWRPRNSRPQCSDGVDNDSDGNTDSNDSGCHTDGNVNNSGSYDPTDSSEMTQSGNIVAYPPAVSNPQPTPPIFYPVSPTYPIQLEPAYPIIYPSVPISTTKPTSTKPGTQPSTPPTNNDGTDGVNPFTPISESISTVENKYLKPFFNSMISYLYQIPDSKNQVSEPTATEVKKPTTPSKSKISIADISKKIENTAHLIVDEAIKISQKLTTLFNKVVSLFGSIF